VTILQVPEIILHSQCSTQRNSTGIILKLENIKTYGQISAIYVVYYNGILDDIYLQVNIFKSSDAQFFSNLFNIFYKNNCTKAIIAIDKVIGRCFFINSKDLPKHNGLEIIIAIEIILWNLFNTN